jgi:hypothetical protein
MTSRSDNRGMDMQFHYIRRHFLSYPALTKVFVGSVAALAIAQTSGAAQILSCGDHHCDNDAAIVLTAEAKADFVTAAQRRAQLQSSSETVVRSRTAESASDGKTQPHYVTYDFGYGWRYKMTNATHQLIIQNEFLLEKLAAMEEGLDGRFKRFVAMDSDSLIADDGYRVITRDEARAALHASEVQYKLEVLGMNLPAHERQLGSDGTTRAHAQQGQGKSPNYELYRPRREPPPEKAKETLPRIAAPRVAEPPPASTKQAPGSAVSVQVISPGKAKKATPVSRSVPATASFPSLESAQPVQTAPSLSGAKPSALKPKAAPSSNARRGPLDRDGVAVPVAPGQPSVSREVYEVQDLEPPLGPQAKAVNHTIEPRKIKPAPKAPTSSPSVGRAAVPTSAPDSKSLRPRVVKSKASAPVIKTALPTAPAPPPPPPGLFGDARANSENQKKSALLPRQAAKLPSLERSKPLAIPGGAANNNKRDARQVEAKRATISPDFGHADRLKDDSWKDRAIKPTLTVEPSTSFVPSQKRVPIPNPPEAYRTKHQARKRVAPVFHTRSDALWERHGASNGNEALVAH